MNGHHSIRRKDRYWAGMSLDLIIKQTLTRSLKSVGEFFRGSGMGESERSRWLLIMPACARVNDSMQEVTGVTYATSEQHKEASKGRPKQDQQDTKTLVIHLTCVAV